MGSDFIPCKDPDPVRPGCYCRCHDKDESFLGICDHRCCTGAQQPEREAETAIDWLDQLVRDGIGAVEFCLTEDGHIGIWVGSQSEEERALATGDTVSECIEAVARKESADAE